MTDRLLRFPPLPTFDPAKDGNPFAWVIANAPRVKAERMAVALAHRLNRHYQLPALQEKADA